MTKTDQPIGILCAIPEELAAFGTQLQTIKTEQRGGLVFHHAQLAGHAVILVECGIGKVNAAMAATLLCDYFHCRALIFTGIAGGVAPHMKIGDAVIATSLIQHDYGRLQNERVITFPVATYPFGEPPAECGIKTDDGLIAAAQTATQSITLPAFAGRAAQLYFGPIVTGDTFLNCTTTRDKLHTQFAALAVEMEGAAIAQIALAYQRPCLVLRALSDLAGDDSHIDFGAFCHHAGHVAALLLPKILPLL